jgi:hypothetical protein
MATSGSAWISTRWERITDPQQFLLLYGPALRRYLQCLIHDAHAADEILQEFLVGVLRHRLATASPDRGRFRDYLKQALRHAVADHYRRQPRREVSGIAWDQVAASGTDASNDAWHEEWRRCVLSGAWRELERYERSTPGNLFYTVLRLVADMPEVDSQTLAALVSQQLDRPVRADAVRQQLSRGRRKFAALIVAGVRRALEQPTAEALEEDLRELGLLPFVRDYLDLIRPPKDAGPGCS